MGRRVVASYTRQLAVLSRKNFLLKKRQTCCVSGCCAELRLGTWSPTCCCFCCPFVVLIWEILLPFLVLCLLAWLRTYFKDAYVPEGWVTVESTEYSNEANDAVQWYHHQPQTLYAQSIDAQVPQVNNGLVTRPMPLADFVHLIHAKQVFYDWRKVQNQAENDFDTLKRSGVGDKSSVSLSEYLADGPGKQTAIDAGDDWTVIGRKSFMSADGDSSNSLSADEFEFAWNEHSSLAHDFTSWGVCAKIALAPVDEADLETVHHFRNWVTTHVLNASAVNDKCKYTLAGQSHSTQTLASFADVSTVFKSEQQLHDWITQVKCVS
jgi:hypothetical protein